MEHLKNISYYQFYKDLDYPIFIKFDDASLELKLHSIIKSVGFEKVANEELGKININLNTTRVLSVKEATPRVARQIIRTLSSFDNLGPEQLSRYGGYDVYRYCDTALMMMGHGEYYWEMGICNCELKVDEIKVSLSRYIAICLANLGVVGFWGKHLEEGFLVTKAKTADYESFYVDVDKGIFISKNGIEPIGHDASIIRIDEAFKGSMRKMPSESLVSFLCHNTTYFSYMGLDSRLKNSIFKLVRYVDGLMYPADYFREKSGLQLP